MSRQSLKVLKLKKRDFRDLCGVYNKLRAQKLWEMVSSRKFLVSTPLLKLLVTVLLSRILIFFLGVTVASQTLIIIRDSPADLTPNPQNFVIYGAFFLFMKRFKDLWWNCMLYRKPPPFICKPGSWTIYLYLFTGLKGGMWFFIETQYKTSLVK